MHIHPRRLVGALVLGLGASVASSILSPAAACSITGDGCPETPSTDGQTVTVTVTGTFVGGGSDGSPGTASVQVSTPCSYSSSRTGKEYAHWVDSGQAGVLWHRTGEEGAYEPHPGYAQHADDNKGRWYYGSCSSESFGDDLDAFFDYTERWFDQNGIVFVEENQTPPTPPVPPELLLQAAQEAMTLPDPVFDWNPGMSGNGFTLVSLDTWFWLDDTDAPDTGTVTASAGGTSVRVEADLDAVEFSSPSAGGVACDDRGTPWAPGASSDCFLTFVKADEATPVTAMSTWALSWFVNGAFQDDLAPITATYDGELRVRESQALVRDVS